VYEIYHDLTALEPIIASTRRFVWISVGLGFLVLYGSLFTLVRNASRQLVRRNEENKHLYEQEQTRRTELAALYDLSRALADALDPDDKDYRTKVAQAQARTDKDILTAGQKIAVAATITEAPLPPVKPAAATSADDQNRTGSVVEYTKKIIAAPEIGLDPDDVLFWIFAGQAPDRNAAGKNIPLDEQIKWAVDQTKQYHSKITPPIDKKKEIADAAVVAANNQQAEMPLSRTTARVPVTDDAENNKPLSLSDAIDSANDLRRL